MLNRSYLRNFKQVIAVRGHLKVSSKLEKTFYDVGTKRNLYCAKVAMTKVSRKTSKRCLGQLLTNKLSINIDTLCVKWIKYLHSTKQLKIQTYSRPPKYLNWNFIRNHYYQTKKWVGKPEIQRKGFLYLFVALRAFFKRALIKISKHWKREIEGKKKKDIMRY